MELLSQLTYLLDYGSDLAFKDDNTAQFDDVSALHTSMGAEVTNKISQLALNDMVMQMQPYLCVPDPLVDRILLLKPLENIIESCLYIQTQMEMS
ncbi:MAG: hypothetical protein J0M33_26975 [Anaerolineae bacterium]|nr:hypothetical protein [Anaerolineae bacterium]